MDNLLLFLAGAGGAAAIKLLDGVIQFWLQRRAKKHDDGARKKTEVEVQLDAVLSKVDRLQDSLDIHIDNDNERNAKQCRTRVLRFNDELIQGVNHTKEHFDDILDDITAYDRYCYTHPLYKNNKAVLAIANVKRTYQKCEEENSFL